MFLTALAWKRLMQGRDGLSLYGRVNNAMETLFCCHTVHVSRSHVAQWPILSKLVESRGGFSEAPDSFCRGEDVSCSSARVPGKCHSFPSLLTVLWSTQLHQTAPNSPCKPCSILTSWGADCSSIAFFCHLTWHSTCPKKQHMGFALTCGKKQF